MNVGNVQFPITGNSGSYNQSIGSNTNNSNSSGDFSTLINQLLNGGNSSNKPINDNSMIDSTDRALTELGDISGLANLTNSEELNKLLGSLDNNPAIAEMLSQFLSGGVSADQMLSMLFSEMPATADKSSLAGLKELFAGKDTDMQNKLMQVLTSLMKDSNKKFGNNELTTVMEIAAMMFNQNYPIEEVTSTVSGLNSSQIQQMANMMGVTSKPTAPDTTLPQPTDTPTQPTADTSKTQPQKTLYEFMSDVKQTGNSIKSMLADLKASVGLNEEMSSSNPSRLETLRNVFAYKTGSNLTGTNLGLKQATDTAPTVDTIGAESQIATLGQQTTNVDPTFTLEQSLSTATQVNNKILELINQQNGKLENGTKELTMQLNPENLGKITVKMIIEAGRMNINVFTETAAAQKMLETRLGFLQDGLKNGEIPIDNVSVVHSPNETMAFSNGFYRESEQNAQNNQQQSSSGYNSTPENPQQEQPTSPETIPDQGYYV